MTLSNEALEELAVRIATTCASLDAATHTLLTELRAFDEGHGWSRQGALSFPQWLSWRCGIDVGAAREKIRVAQALASLPLIDGALRLGELSFSKVRALTRVATADNEATLVELARHATAAQLEKLCRLYRQTQAVDPAKTAAWRHGFVVRETEDGMVRFDIRLRAEEAARVLEACKVSAETRLDGLLAMAEAVLRGDRPDRPPVEVRVHVSAETLEGWDEHGGVSAATAERLLCDAGVVPIAVDGDGTPLDVGRKRRTIPAALRRALVARDRGCRFPGCTHTRWIDAHHVKPWSRGGETSLRNTVLLCTGHHTLLHEGGFRLEQHDDGLRFLDPRGRPVPASGVPARRLRRLDLPIVCAPAPPHWDGGPIDYHQAVSSLC